MIYFTLRLNVRRESVLRYLLSAAVGVGLMSCVQAKPDGALSVTEVLHQPDG